MAYGISPSSLRMSLLEHLRRPIPLPRDSGAMSQRELRFLAFLGWVSLAVGTLGDYATASEWREHGAARDTIQLLVMTVITVAISSWLGFLVRKHRRTAAGATATAR